MTFICACLLGPILAADSVNEERSNGTLGLLFLTRLNSISISLGKLFGHGLLALYSIISVVPIMALPFLLGGTDVASLAKTAVVLCITLLLSLIIGMFASTVCRKPWIAAALALFILTVLTLGVPFLALVLPILYRSTWPAWLGLLSPSYSLLMAAPTAAFLPSNHLWAALGLQLFIALSFFTVINFLLPRIWKEGHTNNRTRYISAAWNWLKYGPAAARRKLRGRLLQINPILWLSCRERFGAATFAAFLLILALAAFSVGQRLRLAAPGNADFFETMIIWLVATPLLYICFCLRFAAAASERFAVDQKAGALELITCTPMKTREIIRGHWLGLLRRSWGAALLLIALHLFTLNYIIDAIRLESLNFAVPGPSEMRDFGLREILIRPFMHLSGVNPIPNGIAPAYIACLAVLTAAVLIVILWIALGWLGMALTLKLKRQILAPWVALILLAVPPVPVFLCCLPFIADQKLFASNLFFAMLRIGACGFFIVLTNALFWIFLARRVTYRNLRPAASS